MVAKLSRGLRLPVVGGEIIAEALPDPECSVDIASAKKNKDVLLAAAEALGWGITNGSGGSVIWVLARDDMVDRLLHLRCEERLSHIPGMACACNKGALAEALQERSAKFCPRSWRRPDVEVDQICVEAFENGFHALIIKPDSGSQGQGIRIARSSKELRHSIQHLLSPEVVVQEYIDRPYLLDGFKWDMRIYALVLPSCRGGMSCFLAHEGLVRVCVDKYEMPTSRNIHKLNVHLTNYSLSKFSDKFCFNSDPERGDQGCKRCLSAVLSMLEARNPTKISVKSMWLSLGHLVRQTVNAMGRLLREAAFNPETWDGDESVVRVAQAKFNQCFHIIGLDVLLDEMAQPWLLEVNNNPSLSIDEVRPLVGVQSKAEVNKLFAEHMRDNKGSPKWGRPCRCNEHPRPHVHRPSPVDLAVKLPVVEGALLIVQRNQSKTSDICTHGTIYEVV